MGDMTHIGAKMRDPTDDLGCGQPVFVTSFMATPLAVRATLTALLKRFHDEVSDDVLGRLQLVLAEVLNNVAEHGASEDGSYGPQIHLCVTRHPRGLACAITDDGVAARQLPLAAQPAPAWHPDRGIARGWVWLVPDPGSDPCAVLLSRRIA